MTQPPHKHISDLTAHDKMAKDSLTSSQIEAKGMRRAAVLLYKIMETASTADRHALRMAAIEIRREALALDKK